jgi:hypothetical protein
VAQPILPTDFSNSAQADEAAKNRTNQTRKDGIQFTVALAQFLFVLPAVIDEGLKEAKRGNEP